MSAQLDDTAPLEAVYWLTPKQVAARLQVHVQTVYAGAADGTLRHIGGGKRGARIRVRPEWADEWWETRLDRTGL